MSSYFKCPGEDQIHEIDDSEHMLYVSMGWIYIGPVPDSYKEEQTIKPLKKKKRSQENVE